MKREVNMVEQPITLKNNGQINIILNNEIKKGKIVYDINSASCQKSCDKS